MDCRDSTLAFTTDGGNLCVEGGQKVGDPGISLANSRHHILNTATDGRDSDTQIIDTRIGTGQSGLTLRRGVTGTREVVADDGDL
jgi:hypothetical protein